MTRLREQGIQYGRAATLSVDSDRLTTCQVNFHQESRQEVAQEADQEVNGDENDTLQEVIIEEKEITTRKAKKELEIWPLNVRGISSEARLQ